MFFSDHQQGKKKTNVQTSCMHYVAYTSVSVMNIFFNINLLI